MDPPGPDGGALRELAEKYRLLAELRARRDRGEAAPGRATLQALAGPFPGCLRELDTLGPAELERRAAAATTAAGGGAREPWMAWIWAYHRLMRAALACKRSIGRGEFGTGQAAALAEEARRLAGFSLDETFVRAVARPPQGRLGPVVLAQLGALFAQPPATIAAALFPTRRPSPYNLQG
jgi:hypothetical protein